MLHFYTCSAPTARFGLLHRYILFHYYNEPGSHENSFYISNMHWINFIRNQSFMNILHGHKPVRLPYHMSKNFPCHVFMYHFAFPSRSTTQPLPSLLTLSLLLVLPSLVILFSWLVLSLFCLFFSHSKTRKVIIDNRSESTKGELVHSLRLLSSKLNYE